MLQLNRPEIGFALHAVRQASRLVAQVQKTMVSTALTKTDRSPVTVADFASQALVSFQLSQAFPGDPLVGEENAGALRAPHARETLERVTAFVARFLPQVTPETVCEWIDRGNAGIARRFWTLDPIDGTKGFLRGDQYAVALALVIDGQVQVGVLGCPNLRDGCHPDVKGPGSIIAAQRGLGTWTASLESQDFSLPAFHRLRVSVLESPRLARLLRSFEAGHTNVDLIDQLEKVLEVERAAVRMDSQAKYAILAAGEGEVLIRLLSAEQSDYREKIWDQAAGSIIIEEAGGRITDLDGKMLDFTAGRTLSYNRGILATNGRLHGAVLQALRQIGA